MKVICEKCESVFKAEAIKGMSCCPVCGASFDEEIENGDSIHDGMEEIDLEHPDMYFYDIDDEEDEENVELRDVWCQCTTCRKVNTIPCNQFKFFEKKYVKLKDGIDICCKGCGKPVTNLIIPQRPVGWRELDIWGKSYENLPKCPICSSTKIHKISLSNKAASALAFGVLAAGHVSKTYKCDTCGAKF